MPERSAPRKRLVLLAVWLVSLAVGCIGPARQVGDPPNNPAVLKTALAVQAIEATRAGAAAPLPTTMATGERPILPTSTQAAPPEAWVDSAGEPAGCPDRAAQAALVTSEDRLAYADRLLGLPQSLNRRILPRSWNALDGSYAARETGLLSLSVGDVQNGYLIQRMLNALQVAGFVTWLRSTPDQGLHILAIPLQVGTWQQTAWAPYLQAYWQSRRATPAGDSHIQAVLKLPPCDWMVDQDLVPRVGAHWWRETGPTWPDYAQAAQAYLAGDTEAATRVARQIHWLGGEGQEGPALMCGPLVWAILQDAGAFPPDFGGWSLGARMFWLAKPRSNGRPWSLFPPEMIRVYRYRDSLAAFDFQHWPLYPGDFLYTYAEGDGFDHMLVVTERSASGEVYTVTNLVGLDEKNPITIERSLLYSLADPGAGLVKNEWNDRTKGRTGHYGFEVMRWAWMEKDILQQPAEAIAQPGDTLGLIAERWKTPVDRIAEYNQIALDARLVVGQKIRIPPNEPAGEETDVE